MHKYMHRFLYHTSSYLLNGTTGTVHDVMTLDESHSPPSDHPTLRRRCMSYVCATEWRINSCSCYVHYVHTTVRATRIDLWHSEYKYMYEKYRQSQFIHVAGRRSSPQPDLFLVALVLCVNIRRRTWITKRGSWGFVVYPPLPRTILDWRHGRIPFRRNVSTSMRALSFFSSTNGWNSVESYWYTWILKSDPRVWHRRLWTISLYGEWHEKFLFIEICEQFLDRVSSREACVVAEIKFDGY